MADTLPGKRFENEWFKEIFKDHVLQFEKNFKDTNIL